MLRALAYLNNFTIFVPTHFITNYNFITAMKTNYLFLLLLSCFIISCENEEPPAIELDSISKIYEGENLQIFLNGEEYKREGEKVALFLPENPTTKNEGTSEKMIIEMLPLFPEVRQDKNDNTLYLNPVFEVTSIATDKEVSFEGNYSNSPQYNLNLKGIWKEEKLMLNLTYTTEVKGLTGNAFVFNLDKESIDLSQLNPRIETIEYGGEQIPIKDFIIDAMAPFVQLVKKQLGGPLRIEFFPDGSTELSIKKEGENTFTPIPGKHGYRIHETNWGYLSSDIDGAKYMKPLLEGGEYVGNSTLYAWGSTDEKFVSIYYNFNQEGDLILSMEEPMRFAFDKFLNYSLQWFGRIQNYRDITEEEVDKANKATQMIGNEINLICFRAEKQ